VIFFFPTKFVVHFMRGEKKNREFFFVFVFSLFKFGYFLLKIFAKIAQFVFLNNWKFKKYIYIL